MNSLNSQQCNEVCRMPWFLVKVMSKSTNQDDDPTYFIVHSVDINEVNSCRMYVNGRVEFDYNHSVLEGKLILASEDRAYIEREMQRITGKSKINSRQERLLLVQYMNSKKDLIHAVIAEREINLSPEVSASHAEEVIITIADNHYRATVLLMSTCEKDIEIEFEKLKSWCLQKCLNVECSLGRDVHPDNWILVQYSKSPLEVVYTTINERETHWPENNLYKDIVTYLKDGEIIYQALVLEKSENLSNLISKIDEIKASATDALKCQLVQKENFKTNSLKCPDIVNCYLPVSDKITST